MKDAAAKKMSIKNLDKLIADLRYILNNLYVDSAEIENSKETLILSQCLDELIVEYMRRTAKTPVTSSYLYESERKAI